MDSKPDLAVRGPGDCKMEQDPEAAESTHATLETQCKQENLDGDWPENCANVYDSLFVAVKHEICDVSYEFEHSRDNEDDVKHKPTRASLSVMNTDRSWTPTDINTGPTSTTTDSLLIKYSLSKPKCFTCQFCYFKCVRSNTFINHMRVHIGRTYTCKHCDYKCGLKRVLDKHMMTHTGEKPFSCELCEAKFSQDGHLKNHMRMHESFHCEHCDYTCVLAVHLKDHMMFHTSGKHFTCDYCDYKCLKTSDLESHLVTHYEKKFACEYCNHRCASASSLKDHVMTHTGEKPFKCKHCDYKCARARDLKRHNAKIHPDKCSPIP